MHHRPLSALIIDGSAPVRTSLRGLIADLGILDIDVAASIPDGRRKILSRKYDLVLCEYHFDGEETGQDLLEEVIDQRMLPPPTLFIVVTTEANYPRVMSVAEITPDEYVLKPVQTGQLADRVERAFKRRDALMELHDAIYQQRYGQALKAAQSMLVGKSPYASDVAKIIGQMLCKLERYSEAAVFYRHIVKTKQLAWAKFGLAKISLRQGDKATAEAMLVDVINQHLRYLPVYDYLVDFYLAEARHAEALAITEKAIEISPHSVKRLQLAGQLAFELADDEKSASYLDRAVGLRGSTVELDFRSMLHLALRRFEQGETANGASMVKQMRAKLSEPDSVDEAVDMKRAGRYCDLGAAAEAMVSKPLGAIDQLRSLAGMWDKPEFDQAFAQDYLAVLCKLYSDDIAGTLADWIRPIGLRFVTSDGVRDLLVARLGGCPRLVQAIAQAGEEIERQLKTADEQEQDGQLYEAAQGLVREAQKSRNNRLLLAAADIAARSFQHSGDSTYQEGAQACLKAMDPPAEAAVRDRLNGMLVATERAAGDA